MKEASLFLLLIRSQVVFGALISALDHWEYMYAGLLKQINHSIWIGNIKKIYINCKFIFIIFISYSIKIELFIDFQSAELF